MTRSCLYEAPVTGPKGQLLRTVSRSACRGGVRGRSSTNATSGRSCWGRADRRRKIGDDSSGVGTVKGVASHPCVDGGALAGVMSLRFLTTPVGSLSEQGRFREVHEGLPRPRPRPPDLRDPVHDAGEERAAT